MSDPCPTCSHDMTALGCAITSGTLWLCVRCGTLVTCDGTVNVSALVEMCRSFEQLPLPHHLADMWNAGIGKSIRPQGEK